MPKQIICLVISIGVFFALYTPAKSAWVDDWVNQRTMTAPSHFEGQKRNYYSGGSFSARWPSTASYPVTIQPPKLKSGCGGIDVFLGGMSFMKAEYLMHKLENILSGAGGIIATTAFDLALKTLCEQCANTIKNFEALSDKLNSMQIDECAASKELVGIFADKNGFHSSEVMRENLTKALKRYDIKKGVEDLWYALTTAQEDNNNDPQPGSVQNVVSGCNADITSTFLTTGSLLDNIASQMGIPASHIDMIRGLVGDIVLSGPAEAYKVAYEPPCSENNPDDIKAIASGDVYAKTAGGTCSQITDANADLRTYVTNMLAQIASKIESKSGTLSSDEITFLDSSPLALLPIIKTSVGTRMQASILDGLAEITADALSLQMLSDLYIRAEAMAWKAREILEKEAGAAAGQPSEDCAAAVFAEGINNNLSIMINRISKLKKSARESYVTAATQMNTILQYLQHMKDVERQMVAEVTYRYGSDTAARIVK